LYKCSVVVSVVRRKEEMIRKKEAISHQDPVLSFIHALQDKSTTKLSNRSNVMQVKNNNVSSMFSPRKKNTIIIIKVFVKCKMLSMEIVLSAYTCTHTEAPTHTQTF